MKIIPEYVCRVENYHYLCSVFQYERAAKDTKMTENNEFLQLKNMNDNELKEWQTQSVKHKVAMVLIMDGVSFSYTEEDGIVFTAPECYVARLIRRLMSCYGCSLRPKINEVK